MAKRKRLDLNVVKGDGDGLVIAATMVVDVDSGEYRVLADDVDITDSFGPRRHAQLRPVAQGVCDGSIPAT